MNPDILYLRVRQLADGRFRVSYYWSVWENTNREYFKTWEEVGIYITDLVKNTRWRYNK